MRSVSSPNVYFMPPITTAAGNAGFIIGDRSIHSDKYSDETYDNGSMLQLPGL